MNGLVAIGLWFAFMYAVIGVVAWIEHTQRKGNR